MNQDYRLNQYGEFLIENYNSANPFSSFLPSIAGLYGKPMWVYYVNRGQCIATMGVNNKDYSIMEFIPANKAYRQTTNQGFRTFLKIKSLKDNIEIFYEPFRPIIGSQKDNIIQRMYITSQDLKIEEINRGLGLRIEVKYCTLPGEPISALIREVNIFNESGSCIEIEMLDGLPVIIPYYIINKDMKDESNLRQAWMGVENHEKIPYYRIKALPYDTPDTLLVEGGNFYINFNFDADGALRLAKTIVEPELVFGKMTDFLWPESFFNKKFKFPTEQVCQGVTPCGFAHHKAIMGENEYHTSYSLIGTTESLEKISGFVKSKLNKTYITEKMSENKKIVESLKSNLITSSSCAAFDGYAGQSYLDNLLRGGYPIVLGEKVKHIFYVYSRKHGDLEREYNFFQIDSTYFSQGNSNFRDVNQNRRNDVRISPYVEDNNIKTFINLIQLDGFNPLVVMGSRFRIKDYKILNSILQSYFSKKDCYELGSFFKGPFTPGSLLGLMEQQGIRNTKGTLEKILDQIYDISEKEDVAEFKEGFWVDHWTYNTDLLESYIAIYPDAVTEMFFEKSDYTYYDNDEIVVSRDKKYVLTDNGVRQLGSVKKLKEKEKLIKGRTEYPNIVRTMFGNGEIYKTTLISKILCLIVNKAASLDPFGVGIEMEANKPGWCDALNGLPAILGSSINESAEVKRLSLLLLDIFNTNKIDSKRTMSIPIEVFKFFNTLCTLLLDDMDEFEYWRKSNEAKEKYREETIFGLSGQEKEIQVGEFSEFLNGLIRKLNRGLEKALDKSSGIYYTYFINEVTDYEFIRDKNGAPKKDGKGYPYVRALSFTQRPIPYFLEGPVHMLRIENDIEKSRGLYKAIKKSGLYDEKLKMYKVNDNIMNETREVGRQNVFPRGWLENEAVFLHMEYKYMLELLKSGLYDEYFECFKDCLIPFISPEVYGRSILENSSFIASSVHPDKKVHGRGFVSRLTGASAEYISMWLYMTSGLKPFYLENYTDLCLEFKPVLPSWLFTTEEKNIVFYRDMKEMRLTLPANTFTFSFLGKIIVILHNQNRKDTVGPMGAKISMIKLFKDDKTVVIDGGIIRGSFAKQVRNGEIDRIEIFMV
jgi:hypothetical protein